MLSSLSSTIITVFGISHLLESSVGEPRRGGLRAPTSDSATRKLVPIRYRNANSHAWPFTVAPDAPRARAPHGHRDRSSRSSRARTRDVVRLVRGRWWRALGKRACHRGVRNCSISRVITRMSDLIPFEKLYGLSRNTILTP